MLSRAALRSIRRPPGHAISYRYNALTGASRVAWRAYSTPKRPPPPPPSPALPSRAKAPPPPPRDFKKASVNGPIEQTSPSTSIPKKAQTPVGGVRPLASKAEPLSGGASPQEPLAQQADVDEPVAGSLREKTHNAQAAAENTEPAAQTDETAKPSQPLPDLRQGLPSTFQFEFGDKKAGQGSQAGRDDGAGSSEQPPESETTQSREREGRDYDQAAYETSLDRRRAQVANYLYASILLIATGGALWLARPFGATEEIPAGLPTEEASGWSPVSMYNRVRARFGSQVGYYTEPTFPKLLPEVPESQRPPFTLVLSLEDLMVHSEWDRKHGYRMAKRPGLDYFIRYLSQYYELVLFTSAPKMMADPVMMKLDPYHFIMWNLGREATKYEGGEYIKDLSYLNRPLSKTIIVDTHAPHVRNQPENAVLLPKWSGDAQDPNVQDLIGLIPFLEYVATMGVDDVRPVLKSFEGKSIPQEFARRENEARKAFMEQLESEKAKRPRKSIGSLAGMLGIKSSPAAAGGMVLSDGSSVSEGLAQGKMLSDQIREQGQKQYEFIEKQIRENGAQWLKDEEEEQKKMIELQMKDMKKGWLGSWSKE